MRKRQSVMKWIRSIILFIISFAWKWDYIMSWKLNTFPDIASPECRSMESSRICDPDGILSVNEIQTLNKAITTIEETIDSPCLDDVRDHNEDDKVKLEIAVVIIKVMYVSRADSFTSVEDLAERFGRGIHDRWGVGDVKCGNGIVLFLSILDRSIYISTGTGLQEVLTSWRVDDVISDMKPFLRQQDYNAAIMNGLETLTHHIERGPPQFMEKYAFFILLFILASIIAMKAYWEARQRRQYAEVSSRLSQIDRDRALALMGQYRCTSCPICLEDFQTQPQDSQEERIDTNETQYVGTDGLRIKLLRCGHAFCQNCWNDWISSGHGDVTKCPVCKEDLNTDHTQSAQPTSSSTDNQQQHPYSEDNHRNNNRTSGDGPIQRHSSTTSNHSHNQQLNRLNRLYERERNFRLMRMMARYPRYLSRSQIDRWTGGSYDGRLVQDSEFVRRDPSIRHHQTSTTRGRSSYSSGTSFGGGRSGGGRGGSW